MEAADADKRESWLNLPLSGNASKAPRLRIQTFPFPNEGASLNLKV